MRIVKKLFCYVVFLYIEGIIAISDTTSMMDTFDFVYLSDIDPSITQSLRYATSENFVGKKINGYNSHKVIMKREVARRLKKIQEHLKKIGYELVVYDAYRPTRAVQHFLNWSKDNDISKKESYYPTLSKKRLFEEGYILATSNHCKGYTVDVSIIKLGSKLHEVLLSERRLNNGEKITFIDDGTIDMGTSFDCFHQASHHNSELISDDAQGNRELLKSVMVMFGFSSLMEEWWHYAYENSTTTEDYDFPIE